MRLADLNSDGDSKLIICDLDKKLKVFKGTSLIVEHSLLDIPVSMCVTYTETSTASVPKRYVSFDHSLILNLSAPYSFRRRCWRVSHIYLPSSSTLPKGTRNPGTHE